MGLISQDYLVTREIALRSGTLENKYRTADGRFILDNRALARIRFTADEYISGLEGVEKITHEEALTLIAQGGYKMGDESGQEAEITKEENTEDIDNEHNQ